MVKDYKKIDYCSPKLLHFRPRLSKQLRGISEVQNLKKHVENRKTMDYLMVVWIHRKNRESITCFDSRNLII